MYIMLYYGAARTDCHGRDETLLHSALARTNHLAYADAEYDRTRREIHRRHRQEPSVSGWQQANRIRSWSAVLELNGFHFTASEEAAAQAVLELAAGALDETGFSAFLRTPHRACLSERLLSVGMTEANPAAIR